MCPSAVIVPGLSRSCGGGGGGKSTYLQHLEIPSETTSTGWALKPWRPELTHAIAVPSADMDSDRCEGNASDTEAENQRDGESPNGGSQMGA